MRQCSYCGVVRGSVAIFCNLCGTRLPKVPEPEDPEDRDGICDDLGHLCQLALGAEYCPICGEDVFEVTRHIKQNL